MTAPAYADEVPAAGDFTVSGFVEQVTDYRYRGVSQTAGDAAIQGQITVSHSSGFYANLWATNLEDSDVAGTTEWDAGIGWTGEIAPGLTLDTGLYLFFFPNGHVGNADIFEPFVALSTKIGPVDATAGVYYSWKQDSLGGDDNIYLSTELSAPIARTPLSLNAHLGYTDGALSPNRQTEKSMSGGFDYSLGASYQVTKALPASALLTTVFLQQGYTGTLPETGGLVLLDKIYVVAYVLIVATLARVIIKSLDIEQKDEAHLASLRKKDAVALAVQVIIFAVSSAVLVASR